MEPTATHEVWYAGKCCHLYDMNTGKIKYHKEDWMFSQFTPRELAGMNCQIVPINFSLENK